MNRVRTALAGLRVRLLLAHLVVILVGLATVYGAARLAAPGFVERHMADMMRQRGMNPGVGGPGMPMMPGPGGGPMVSSMEAAIEETYRVALGEALMLAAGVALAAAVLASLFVSHQLARPIQCLAAASRRIARGERGERVEVGGATELAQLAASFNAMAEAVEDAERRRLELIGDVAHELRTPIATLEGYLEGLLDGVVEPSDRVWAKLHTEAGRLRRLVEDLQELSRAEAHQLSVPQRAVAPAGLVRAAVERIESDVAAKGLALAVDVPDDLPAVRADPDRAVQVLTNLLTNALRYTPAPGEIAVSAMRAGDMVRFQVRDTGIGIPPEHLPHVFERFYRVDKSRSRALGGAGVGLTIARALVEAMGGRIWAESPGAGRGSTFTIELPLAHG
ncbi:MAG: HAMP domain-containing histidine kinase [Chloroflexota bacterium]|nr:HAMP domain-containing histidine kinase [Chloroflexota bacterium]